jgi:hypothetical protein
VYKPPGEVVSLDVLKDCWDGNKDGAGLMFAEDGQLKIAKGFMKWKSFKKYMKKFDDDRFKRVPMAFHFRIATHGSVNPQNCHPFKVHDDLWFAHNGIISSVDVPKDEDISDTEAFARQYLAALHLNLDGGLRISHLASEKYYGKTPINDLIGKFIGGSKLVFMDGSGQVAIVNELQGVWDKEIWFSNRTYKRVKTYSTYKNGYSGYSGGGWSWAGGSSRAGSSYSLPARGTAMTDDAEERRHAAEQLGSNANINYLANIRYHCNDCWEMFYRKEARRIAYNGGTATVYCPRCGGINTEDVEDIFTREASKTDIDMASMWICYDCDASFWEDEASAEVQYHEKGPRYLVCPWCASTRTYVEEDDDLVLRYGDGFFDGEKPDDERIRQARIDYNAEYGDPEPEEDDSIALIELDEDWNELERETQDQWDQLLADVEEQSN